MVKHLTAKMILLLSILAYSMTGFAQSGEVTGVITDALDGSTLPGATVVVKGTVQGTVTDINGNYSITVEPNTTLVFSFVGYETQEMLVQPGNTVNVALMMTSTALEEFVVIGYGVQKKEDLTGSISVVGAKDFNQGNITSPQDLLVGKSAGVVITNSGGAPGGGATIRIRGGSSLNASNDPLVIIDGVPIDNNNVSGSSNFMSFVNPNDIETFTVLKDASATAIYGSRASNGVILITTKKGKAGNPLSLTYNGNVSISAPIEYVDVFSGDEVRKIAFDNPQLYTPETYNLLGNQNTNWQEEIFRTSVSQDHNVSVSGSYQDLPYRASIGYTDQVGILENTDMQRVTGALNLNPTLFDDHLKINFNLKAMSANHNFGDAGAVGSAIAMDPTQPIRDGNSASAGYYQWENYGANLGTPNPVEQAMAADNKSDVTRLIGNIQLDYKFHFLPELRANLNVAGDYSNSDGYNNRPVTSPGTLTSPLNGRLTDYSSENSNELLDFYLNYAKYFDNIKSRIDVTAGYSWQHFQVEGENYTRGIIDENNPYQSTDSSSYINENYLVSFFGRFNYEFNNKYLLTFTMRNDGSSRFSEDNRWGLFPSAAFAWKINEESFMQGADYLSDLKLRLGWGVTGQQDIGSYYPYMSTYIESSPGSYYFFNGQYIPTLRPSAYDPNIKWEETTTQNIGVDFGFFDDRITGSVDLYKRVTDDLLNEVTVPTGSNFSNRLITNVGSLENKGVEASLNLIPVSTEDMSLDLAFNFTYNQQEITKLLQSDDPEFIGVLYGDAFTGQNQVTRVGYPGYSFFVNKQIYDANGNPIEGLYEDLSGIGGSVAGDNNDKYIYKNPNPDYLIGFSFNFDYKNFNLGASTRTSIGNYVYNQVAASASYDQMYQIGYWRNQPKYLAETNFVKRQFTSDYFVENASFFKVDYLSLGYQFNNIVNSLNAHLSFTVQNLLTVTEYSGIDPEVPGGIDNNFYPRPRTFVIGLRLTY
jgi:TonB-dependent starch-binding outer membrane protein SusC